MKIAVHRFQVWDSISDTMKTSSRYATIDAIKEKAHGVPVPGTEILIDASEILWEFFAPLAVTLLAKESTSLRVRRIDN